MLQKLRRLLADFARGVRENWERFQEYGFLSEAEARGLALLKDWLSPEQLAQYNRHGHFDVTGCHSGRRYRIRYGVGMNIHELDSCGRPLTGWCFVPKEELVAGDVMLAQKIALETNERTALLIAKTFSLRWGHA